MIRWISLSTILLLNTGADTLLGRGKTVLNEAAEDFFIAATPNNLSAFASVYNISTRHLQLNISWRPNKSKPASGYNLHIWPLNQSDTYCSNEPYYAFIDDPNSCSWVVPQADHGGHSLSIIPGCTYRIRIEANPHDGSTYTQLIYNVPDCVEEICSCRHAVRLPKPQLHVQHLDQQAVNISWHLSDLNNISSFVVRIGQKLVDGEHSAIYNLSWSRQVSKSTGWLNYEARGAGRYAVAVRAVDTRQCTGPEQYRPFTIESALSNHQEPIEESQVFWLALLPLGTFILVGCLVAALLGQNYLVWLKNKTKNSIIIRNGFSYKTISLKSEKVFRRGNSLQERNVLYVEKEIEEAKARGEVDDFEISYNRLTFQREIGRGAFGQVFLAKADAIMGVPGSRLVAVKKLKASAGAEEKNEFLKEISMLKRVGQHPNIVSLLACCTLEPDVCMVMEFVPCGDLLKYLQDLRQKFNGRKLSSNISMSDGQYSMSSTIVTSLYSHPYTVPQTDHSSKLNHMVDHRELHNFAIQIAMGMAHLEAKKITHRDLAARNILIDHNKVLKISDFGLSRRGVYVNSRKSKVPLRWLSIEAMRDSLYSSKSDVWAFAILLWEIGTLGGFPYPTVDDYDLLQYLKNKKRLEKPDIVSDNLYAVMLKCWSEIPDERPSFAELVFHLQPKPDYQVYVEFTTNPQLPPLSEYVPMTNFAKRTFL